MVSWLLCFFLAFLLSCFLACCLARSSVGIIFCLGLIKTLTESFKFNCHFFLCLILRILLVKNIQHQVNVFFYLMMIILGRSSSLTTYISIFYIEEIENSYTNGKRRTNYTFLGEPNISIDAYILRLSCWKIVNFLWILENL